MNADHRVQLMEVSSGKLQPGMHARATSVRSSVALRPVLIDCGLFDSFTPEVQAAKLNAVAAVGIEANALCKLPLGICLDVLGPQCTALVGAVLLS